MCEDLLSMILIKDVYSKNQRTKNQKRVLRHTISTDYICKSKTVRELSNLIKESEDVDVQ